MSEVQAQAIGDRLRNLIGIGELLKGIDLSKLSEIIAAFTAAASAEGTAAKITAYAAAFKVLASATATEVDDRIAATLETIVSGPLKDILAAVIDRWLASRSAGEFQAASVEMLTTEEQEQFQAAGFDPSFIIMVIQLILSFWKK